MIGMFVTSDALIDVLLTSKWASAAIYMRIGCIAYMFRPVQFINNSVIKASGQSGILLKIDIIKKLIGIIILIISMNFGGEGSDIGLYLHIPFQQL